MCCLPRSNCSFFPEIALASIFSLFLDLLSFVFNSHSFSHRNFFSMVRIKGIYLGGRERRGGEEGEGRRGDGMGRGGKGAALFALEERGMSWLGMSRGVWKSGRFRAPEVT
jgi:hypothetical protein